MMRSTNEEEEREYKEQPDNCYHSNRKKAKCCSILFLLEIIVILLLTASSCIDGLQFSSTKSIPTSSTSSSASSVSSSELSQSHNNKDIDASSSLLSRRQILVSAGVTTTATVITAAGTTSLLFPGTVHAAAATTASPKTRVKGAAELDLEYYLRDLVQGNKKEGSGVPSTIGIPTLSPPRTLTGPIMPMVLNKDCTADCITIRALIEILQEQEMVPGRTTPITKNAVLEHEIQHRVTTIRDRTQTSFYTKAPWQNEEMTDQYYFDFTAYAVWKTAAQLIETNTNRDKFIRTIGRMFIHELEEKKLLTEKASTQTGTSNSNTDGVLVRSIPAITEVLTLFQTSRYCKNYRIRSSDNDGVDNTDNTANTVPIPVFDAIDDESFVMSGNINCLVSIYEPATLGASLQINGENSRFGPDLIGTSLAAIWEHYGIRTTWDVFFVDPEYRPNPKDYFPNEQLLQMTLKPT